MLRTLSLVALLGMLALLPFQFIALPLNLAPIDLVIVPALPVLWLYLAHERQAFRLPFALSMWVILFGSFVATAASPVPLDSLVAISKDVFLYVWFLTIAAILASLDTRTLRRVLLAWLAVAVGHGVLVVAQLASPTVLDITIRLAAHFGALDAWRPSGLFNNANGAAIFQLMGFAPLVLARPPRLVASAAGTLLFLGMVGTGSLGAAAAFLGGLAVALAAVAFLGGSSSPATKVAAQLGIVVVLLGGLALFVVSQDPDLSGRLTYMFVSRAGGSAAGRFGIWERGVSLLSEDMPLWGVGPDGYKHLDLANKTLHNDLLAFLIERGLLGALGAALFGLTALSQSLRLVVLSARRSAAADWTSIILLAAVVATLVDSQFHQVFHERAVWLMLALQEAMVVRTMTAAARPPASPPLRWLTLAPGRPVQA